jgi:hypothetical protein
MRLHFYSGGDASKVKAPTTEVPNSNKGCVDVGTFVTLEVEKSAISV